MQHSDERPPTSGRPSLLSTEQQADADRHRILGALDDKSMAGPTSAPGQRKYSWVAAGIAALVAVGAASAFWLTSEGEKEIVLASSVPLPAAPAAAAPLVSEPAPANPEADEVSTAAILQDVPAAPAAAAAVPGKQGSDELTSLLERPAAEPAAAEGASPAEVLNGAPAKTEAAPAKPAAKPAVQAASKAPPKKLAAARPSVKTAARAAQKKDARAPHKSAAAAAPSKKKAEAPAKAVDTDVTLLAALVAHSKATQPKKTVTPAEKLRQCKTLGSVAAADECRARVCAAGAKNEAQCKAQRLAKASGE